MAGRKKFKQLVHYACDICENPSRLGATKLNKVLWFADTYAYRLRGKTISGEDAYVKRQFGPVPKGIMRALDELRAEGKIHVREVEYFGKAKKEFQVLEASDPSAFDDTEREIVRQVVEIICNDHTAASISDLSHDDIWEAAEIGEEIPISAVLAAAGAPPTKEDQKWANEVIATHQAEVAAA